MKRITFFCLVLALLFAGSTSTLAAEKASSSIHGTVGYYLISAGSEWADVAEKANVTLQNDKGEVIATTITDAAGEYSFAAVHPGSYKVVASYQEYTKDAKTLTVEADQSVKVKLEVYNVFKPALEDYLKQREEIGVYINNERKWFEQPPVLLNDTTLVPMRAIFEELGAKITWDEVKNAATATKGDVTVGIVIDSDEATINDEPVKLAEKAQLINDKTMVPLRFVSEALGAKVEWDGANNEVLITMESESIDNDYKVIDGLVKGSGFTAKLVAEDKIVVIKEKDAPRLDFRRVGSKKLIGCSWLSNLDDKAITLGKNIVDKYTGSDASDLVETVKKIVADKKPVAVVRSYDGHEVKIELIKIVDSVFLRIMF